MALTIGSNIVSLSVNRRVNSADAALRRSLERVSSGSRINKASDDAAGLAIADSLRAQQRVASVAVRNTNDAISLTSVAHGALNEIQNVLERMRELAAQGSSSIYNLTQHSTLNQEFRALGSEIQRIADSTAIFGMRPLSGDTNSVYFQIGLTGASVSQLEFRTSNISATVDALSLGVGGNLSFSLVGSTIDDAVGASRSAFDAVTNTIESVMPNIRGYLGASESRLQSAVNTTEQGRLANSAAESRIRDADIASEAADLVRNQIARDVAGAILAQSNQQPQIVLRLLNASG